MCLRPALTYSDTLQLGNELNVKLMNLLLQTVHKSYNHHTFPLIASLYAVVKEGILLAWILLENVCYNRSLQGKQRLVLQPLTAHCLPHR